MITYMFFKLTVSSIQNSEHLFTNMFYFWPSGASQSCAGMQIGHGRQADERCNIEKSY